MIYQGVEIQPRVVDTNGWNESITNFSNFHLLQTSQWGELKSNFGWKPEFYVWKDKFGQVIAATMLLERKISTPWKAVSFKIVYLPKGPLCNWENVEIRNGVLSDLINLARKRKVIFIKIDPDVIIGTGVPSSPKDFYNPVGQDLCKDLTQKGWVPSREQVQFKNTVILDLSVELEDILANMKQKTRYNIRLAEKKGVTIRSGEKVEFSKLYRIYAETSLRDHFIIREAEYYQTLWSIFYQAGMLEPLIAEVENSVVAGIFVFRFQNKAWYIHGMSKDIHRDKMPNYLLQWEAICRLKNSGCVAYDLWGAPEEFSEKDPLWRVFRFKVGLGGEVVRHIGAYDYAINRFGYFLYTRIMPLILHLMRRQGSERTLQLIG